MRLEDGHKTEKLWHVKIHLPGVDQVTASACESARNLLAWWLPPVSRIYP